MEDGNISLFQLFSVKHIFIATGSKAFIKGNPKHNIPAYHEISRAKLFIALLLSGNGFVIMFRILLVFPSDVVRVIAIDVDTTVDQVGMVIA